jgi:DedD protein
MANTPTDSASDGDAAQDAQQDLKRRARRRLVGATALALLAVIVLPMVMDSEPRPPLQDIQVRIPSQDSGSLAARVLPGKAPTPMPPPADSKATAAPAEPDAAANGEAGTAVKPEAKPEGKAAAKPTPPARPAEKPAAQPGDKKGDKDAARAVAALAGTAATAAASEQWVVQLGAYKEAGNVSLLTKKLKEMGVPTYTEKSDSPQGPRTRVRAGPFATKEAAEKAQAKAKAIGVSGSVAPR